MRRLFYGVAVLGLLGVLSVPVVSQVQDQAREKAGGEDPAAMMKKWMEVATPGPAHKVLEPLVGEWDLAVRMWMAGPKGPVTESRGSASVKWVLGGRFLQEETTGEMMGMPHQGLGLTGYDNFKKKYVNCWIDNMGTGMYTSQGTLDRSGKILTSYGEMDEFLTGEHDKPVKYVLRLVQPDKHVFEIYDLAQGDDAKVMEITYTRRGSK